jgi:hypothetical protein
MHRTPLIVTRNKTIVSLAERSYSILNLHTQLMSCPGVVRAQPGQSRCPAIPGLSVPYSPSDVRRELRRFKELQKKNKKDPVFPNPPSRDCIEGDSCLLRS